MREIGIVTRFTPPTRNNQEQAFAFIKRLECKGTPDILVYKKQLRGAVDEFRPGMFVEFEIGTNSQKDREEAQYVRLLTQVAQVKYFGVDRDGSEIDYGVARLIDSEKRRLFHRQDREGNPEVFLHKKNCLSSFENLLNKKQALIAFEIWKHERRSRDEAINIRLLTDLYLLSPDTEEYIINKCVVKTSNHRLWQEAIGDIFNSLVAQLSEEESPENEDTILRIAQVLKELPSTQYPAITRRLQDCSWLKQHEVIFQLLSPVEKASTLIAQLSEEESSENEATILRIAQIIEESSSRERLLIISRLPNLYWLKQHEAIFKFLSPVEKASTLIAQLSEEESSENENTILRIAQVLEESSPTEHPAIIMRLRDYSWVKRHEAVFKFLSPAGKVNTLIKQLREGESPENEDIILRIARLLEESSLIERSSIISRLQDYSWVKRHEVIFQLLSPIEQVDTLVSQLTEEKSPENENIILRIARLLENYSSNNQLLARIQKHPNWKFIKESEAIFQLFKPEDKIKIIAERILNSNQKHKDIQILKLSHLIEESSLESRASLVAKIPISLKREAAIFNFLTIDEKIDLTYLSLERGSSRLWQQLLPKEKILCVYYIAKDSKNLANILSTLQRLQQDEPETDLRVKCVLNLLRAKIHPLKKDEVFKIVNQQLIDYVIEQAQSSDELLDLDPLLPHCLPTRVTAEYCEGRPWLTEEDKKSNTERPSLAYCPRTRQACKLFSQKEQDNLNEIEF